MKIGCTDVEWILRLWRANCKVPLELIGCFSARRSKVWETHYRLNAFHVGNNWYQDVPEVRQAVENYKSLYPNSIGSDTIEG